MQPARERPLQRADPGQLRRLGRWIHESGRDDAELCNGDPDAGRPHADPGTAVRAVHRRRPRYDVVVRDERPLRDRDRRGHGGSGLSSLGGTIRLGELVPGGVIRHVMKINLYGLNNYYYGTTQGYRWPASQADGCASSCYGGTTQALRMGSLLAIPASVNVDSLGLETEPAKILARALQDYGAYTVDDTAWSVYAIATEFGPAGRVDTEFSTAWGFAINPSTKTVPWARDMDRLFGALNVVDNWDAAQWATVSASSGAQGAGGGAPIVPWAPDFGTGTPGPSEPPPPGPSLPP